MNALDELYARLEREAGPVRPAVSDGAAWARSLRREDDSSPVDMVPVTAKVKRVLKGRTRMVEERAGRELYSRPERVRLNQALRFIVDTDKPSHFMPATEWGKPNLWESNAVSDIHKNAGKPLRPDNHFRRVVLNPVGVK